jgi:hypothetical protein
MIYNNDIYMMSAFGSRYRLHVATGTVVREPKLEVDDGLVYYGGVRGSHIDRRSRTAILLDALAEICVERTQEIYAVGLAVPVLDDAAVQTAKNQQSIPTPRSQIAPTLVVASNCGVSKATRPYLKEVLELLRCMAESESTLLPSHYEPLTLSPRRVDFSGALGKTLL